MKSLFAIAFATLTAAVTFAAPSHAAPITEGVWQLENRNHSSGFYFNNGNGHDYYDFEANGAEMLLTYDATAGTIDIEGSAYDTVGNRFVNFDLDYTGVVATDDRVATEFSDLVGTVDGIEVMSKGSGGGQSLFLDALIFDQTASGNGWLATAERHFGDFHFEATRVGDLQPASVPVPGGLAFLLVGVAAFYRRKRSAQ